MKYKNIFTAFLVLSGSLLATGCGMGLSLGINDGEGEGNNNHNDPDDDGDSTSSSSTSPEDIFLEKVDAEACRTAFAEAIKQIKEAQAKVQGIKDELESKHPDHKLENSIEVFQKIHKGKGPIVTKAHQEVVTKALETVLEKNFVDLWEFMFEEYAEDIIKKYFASEMKDALSYDKTIIGKKIISRAEGDIYSVEAREQRDTHGEAIKISEAVSWEGLSSEQAAKKCKAVQALKSIAIAAAAAEKIKTALDETFSPNHKQDKVEEAALKSHIYMKRIYEPLLEKKIEENLSNVLKALEAINNAYNQ